MHGTLASFWKTFVVIEANFHSPGRFYFSFAIQVLASYLLLNFDCELKDPKIRNFTWGENSVPSSSSVLLMKKKSKV